MNKGCQQKERDPDTRCHLILEVMSVYERSQTSTAENMAVELAVGNQFNDESHSTFLPMKNNFEATHTSSSHVSSSIGQSEVNECGSLNMPLKQDLEVSLVGQGNGMHCTDSTLSTCGEEQNDHSSYDARGSIHADDEDDCDGATHDATSENENMHEDVADIDGNDDADGDDDADGIGHEDFTDLSIDGKSAPSIPKGPFRAFVNGMVRKENGSIKIRKEAVNLLHYMAEAHLVKFFKDTKMAANHAGRKTVFVEDMRLVKKLNKTDTQRATCV